MFEYKKQESKEERRCQKKLLNGMMWTKYYFFFVMWWPDATTFIVGSIIHNLSIKTEKKTHKQKGKLIYYFVNMLILFSCLWKKKNQNNRNKIEIDKLNEQIILY